VKPAPSFKSRLIRATALVLIAGLAGATLFGFHRFRNPVVFIHAHILVFGSLALAFVLGGLWQIKKGLSESNQLRSRLLEVREGKTNSIEGLYPAEVQPLVDDLNTLIEQRERAISRAQAKAGDLAHGLKTPLALLSHQAELASAAGLQEVGDAITQQVERMKRQVDYHLAHARAAASSATLGARCLVSDSANGLVRTLRLLYAERGIAIESTVPVDHAVQAQREDVDEMIGNLLDNACRWARTRVTVSSSVENANLAILVDDDGPGLEASKRDIVLKRGVRADETAPGSGLGLAIVRDLAEVYGGTITLEASPLGGLRARLTLPKLVMA
jgi:signal transduction histidine kinase